MSGSYSEGFCPPFFLQGCLVPTGLYKNRGLRGLPLVMLFSPFRAKGSRMLSCQHQETSF
mgnify:CR=1 FL=1